MQILKNILEVIFYPFIWLYKNEVEQLRKQREAEALMSAEEYIQAWADRGW